MNAAKSDFGDTSVTYEQMPGGEIKATMDGQSYTFKTDGKDNKTPWGTTMAAKTVDANTWEMTEKTNGKVSNTSTMKLSADGKMLSLDSKRVKADGGDFQRFHDLPACFRRTGTGRQVEDQESHEQFTRNDEPGPEWQRWCHAIAG